MDASVVIKDKIRELEKTHQIHILFACESGSRAWGFPSPDSDYDARFIYVHPQEWYLSIHERRDVIELPVNSLLDINGWDLRKTLRLLQKRNAVIFEWIQSPIIYASNDAFVTGFNEILPDYFSPIAVMHHYLNSAKKHFEDCTGDKVKLKKLLYCLRATLAGVWIAQTHTIPPMELEKLLKVIDDKADLVRKIKDLVQLKATRDESYLHPLVPTLDEFLKEGISLCESVAPGLPGSTSDEAMLNTFFRKMIR